MSERQILEVEVASHEARVAEITAALRNLQENLDQSADPPALLQRQAELLRMELRGRSAAVAVGSARLRMLRNE